MHTKASFTRLDIAVHWLMAVTFIGLITLGVYMTKGEHWYLYHWHKSVGLMAMVAILARLWYRLRRGWLVPVRRYPAHERWLAKISHWCLLAGILLLPMTGMLYSGASGNGFGIFTIPLFPKNLGADGVEALHAGFSAFAQKAHSTLGYVLLTVITLHVLGALKHHFLDQDDTLRRMFSSRVD